MKNLSYLFLFSLLVSSAFAQKIIEKRLSVANDQWVNLNLKFGDSIRIRYWDKSEVSIRIAVTVNGGRLNDALLVTTGSTEQEVTVKTDFDKELIKQGKAEDCPGATSTWRSDRNGQSHYLCSDINYQVFLPRKARLKVETISGNIDIEGATAAVFAKTISGYVDMNWPKGQGANLEVKTITGEVYSNLNIDFKNKKQKHPMVGYLLEGTTNGGGADVHLESISNNIFLRRKE
ncbi:DUF4097 domain-containing protein [Spirosoma sp. RP8]|uniref:DUF4097 domain-containing protein n=1 Tax=Spirosoma liriopis TaxID=2937440 RepID=A0ABT0HQ29_9BACT|nr:DUF4097 domain-containing protein [Spirosoma liriopis]MCK8494271.1 DUF4097 domain-containing protein [Spirosoma liriopis]